MPHAKIRLTQVPIADLPAGNLLEGERSLRAVGLAAHFLLWLHLGSAGCTTPRSLLDRKGSLSCEPQIGKSQGLVKAGCSKASHSQTSAHVKRGLPHDVFSNDACSTFVVELQRLVRSPYPQVRTIQCSERKRSQRLVH